MGISPLAGDPVLVAFGRRVRSQRTELGITQNELAAGLGWSYISQIERGLRNVTLFNIVQIARGLDAHPGELFDGEPGAFAAVRRRGRQTKIPAVLVNQTGGSIV